MQLRKSSVAMAASIAAVFAITWYVASRPLELPAVPVAATVEPAVSAVRPVEAGAEASAAPPAANVTTAQWIADSSSGDASKRAAAITALAEAPRAEALPVLGRLLTDGEPQVDRALALRSLHVLAQKQGDADGAIREAVRHAIYHGDDLTNKDEVQATLDAIEASHVR